MQKEEFPTFLNEQPTVIFGRTGRELLVIVCGIVGGYLVWNNLHLISGTLAWTIVSGIVTGLVVIGAFIVALVQVANRPLEEWFFCWLLFFTAPKMYLFQPCEEEVNDVDDQQTQKQRKTHASKKGKVRTFDTAAELFEEE